jgi:hypothetical protein
MLPGDLTDSQVLELVASCHRKRVSDINGYDPFTGAIGLDHLKSDRPWQVYDANCFRFASSLSISQTIRRLSKTTDGAILVHMK